jgi:hypothetical protein
MNDKLAVIVSPEKATLPAMPHTRAEPAFGSESRPPQVSLRNSIFQAAWRTLNILLIIWVIVALCSMAWEYSTRMYLKGFSDAVVPSLASPEEQVEAILNWMSHGPSRREAVPFDSLTDRDPASTLNYESLLKVCGSSTNAFINLADSAGLVARRLLLLDTHSRTQHVVAEVLIGGRWVIVDPAFRAIMRNSDGELLTREQLTNHASFADATSRIPNYDPNYTFDNTVHVRVTRLPLIGTELRWATDRFFRSWEGWATVSLLLERESLAATFVAITLVFLVSVLRVFLRQYGELCLKIRPIRFRSQVSKAFRAFLEIPS